jgi:hypothetical protein
VSATTEEQKMAALEHANDRRIWRAHLRARVKTMGRDGALELSRVLLHDHEMVDRMDIGDYLMLAPGVGRQTAKRMLRRSRSAYEVEVSPWRQICNLSERERAALALELENHAKYGRVYTSNKRPL